MFCVPCIVHCVHKNKKCTQSSMGYLGVKPFLMVCTLCAFFYVYTRYIPLIAVRCVCTFSTLASIFNYYIQYLINVKPYFCLSRPSVYHAAFTHLPFFIYFCNSKKLVASRLRLKLEAMVSATESTFSPSFSPKICCGFSRSPSKTMEGVFKSSSPVVSRLILKLVFRNGCVP